MCGDGRGAAGAGAGLRAWWDGKGCPVRGSWGGGGFYVI